MKHPRNQILHAMAAELATLKVNNEVKKIAVSFTTSTDHLPFIAIRSDNEEVEQIDFETNERELLAVIHTIVHADDDAIDMLDHLASSIETLILEMDMPEDLRCQSLALVGTQFPDLPGDNLSAAAVFFRVIYHTPV